MIFYSSNYKIGFSMIVILIMYNMMIVILNKSFIMWICQVFSLCNNFLLWVW